MLTPRAAELRWGESEGISFAIRFPRTRWAARCRLRHTKEPPAHAMGRVVRHAAPRSPTLCADSLQPAPELPSSCRSSFISDVVIDRLDHVRVEARLLDRWRSSSWPQPVSATSTMSLPHGFFPDAAAHFVAVHAAAGRCRAAPRRGEAARRPRSPARPSCALCVSWPSSCSSIASDSAPSSLSSTIRMRRRTAGAVRWRHGAADAARALRPEPAAAPTNSLPRPETLAACFDRAAVHLHQRLHQRQADAQAVARSLQRRIHLREHLEQTREAVRRRCRCRCRARG